MADYTPRLRTEYKDRIVKAIERSAAAMGLPALSYDENKSVIGLGLREALQALYPSTSEHELDDLIGFYRENYLSLDLEEPSELYEGAMDVLERLKSDGHQLAVATGKSRQGLDRVLNHLGMLTYFDATRCADETRSKPHPLMVNQILAETGQSPQNAIMVGDTDFDLLMGIAAGTDAIGVSYGAHDVARLAASRPSRIVDHLSELLPA